MMPYEVLPPEPRQADPLDDTAVWPGAVEAEHAPEDLDEREVLDVALPLAA